MQKFHWTLLLITLILLTTSGCALPRYTTSNQIPTSATLPTLAFPTPTALPAASAAAISLTSNLPVTIIPTPLPSTSIPQIVVTQQVASANFCLDSRATILVTDFKAALQTSDGKSLAHLVSSTHGLDVRYYRDGRVVNYDQTHAQFLFDSTFQVDWGTAPGSGLSTKGSFHEIVLPSLLDLLDKNFTLTCNQIQVGGTTYQASWPYPGINFYSLYFPGTTSNGNMDWHTWVIGMEYAGNQPYLYAIMQFQWEP